VAGPTEAAVRRAAALTAAREEEETVVVATDAVTMEVVVLVAVLAETLATGGKAERAGLAEESVAQVAATAAAVAGRKSIADRRPRPSQSPEENCRTLAPQCPGDPAGSNTSSAKAASRW